MAWANARDATECCSATDEPYVQVLLDELRSRLVHLYRNDPELRAAQQDVDVAERGLVEATDRRDELGAAAEAAAAAVAVAGTGSGADVRAARTVASLAGAELRRAEANVLAARLTLPQARAALQAAEVAVIDQLTTVATSGVAHLNAYIGASNIARAYFGRRTIEPFSEEFAAELVRWAVGPIDLAAE